MFNQVIHAPHVPPLLEWQGLRILPGLNAITGDEGSGKTTLLCALANHAPDALWLDLRLPGQDEQTPAQVWRSLETRCTKWNEELQAELIDAFGLREHLDKPLFMLSTGSRRKVALVGLLASGAALVCLDQPFAALDMASVRVLRDFLGDMAHHDRRAWVVADYAADAGLSWRSVIELS